MILVDWGNTNIIHIPKTYLTLVSGTFYTLDTNLFRLDLKKLESDPYQGLSYPKTHIHNTEVTVAGTTFVRTIEILPPYRVEFENGQYSVQLQGSNNNIFDVQGGILVQNQVQVIPTNSAGLVVTNTGVQVTDWNDTEREQIREALGVDGNKNQAVGGQIQTIKDLSEISSIHAVEKLNN